MRKFFIAVLALLGTGILARPGFALPVTVGGGLADWGLTETAGLNSPDRDSRKVTV